MRSNLFRLPHRFPRVAATAACALAIAPAACTDSSPAAAERAAIVDGRIALGDYARPVSTRSPIARRHFDEGLRWLYAFNHDEAVRSFYRATETDPDCAMAWWGIAICRGPHINNPAMDEASSREAWAALARARAAAPSASPVEQGLIGALAYRYADPDATRPLPLDPAARAPLDRAYADAMERLYARFPGDDDVATLTAEALMDLRPWDLYDVDGSPRPETPRIVATLESVLARRPDHPGANHYYIHAVEASARPQRADDAATRLRSLVPGSGHLVHMPAHIDVRLGRWNLAADQNERAMAVHRAYTRLSPRQGFYRAYMFHNQHFLAYACMMAGRSADAIANAREMVASIPAEFYDGFAPVVDAYAPITVEALLRFGRWDDILREPEPRADLPITRAFWRFARAVALAAKGDAGAGRAEQLRFREAVRAVPAGATMAINPASKVLTIADRMLEGELRYREGDLPGAVENLRAAVAVEDTLLYMEPPDWVQPVRHALGAILLQAGRAAEAADVYREDLRRWPENGWSLQGLARCEQALGRAAQAAELRARFGRAWSRADVPAETSCFCVTARP
ncbi:MAG: tetratricopeptide repeat protein [Phycisphaeraceae bacterium]|nr:tetratricopeptide repeat protein [Phycisphaeraceae bacterium]